MTESARDDIARTISAGLSRFDSPEYEQALEILREMPGDNVREIFRELLDDPPAELALGIAKAAGIIECGPAADLLIELADEPGKWFGHAERAEICLAAVHSLGILRDPAAIDILFYIIDHSRDTELTMEAILSIGNIGAPESGNALVSRMYANPPIALSAAGALVQIGGDDAFQGLVRGLKHKDEIIVSASVWALGKMGNQRAINPLVSLMGEGDTFLRRDIAWALGQIGGVQARLILGALCQNDPDFGVRQEAAKAIREGAVLSVRRL